MKIVKYCCGFFILGAIMTDFSWVNGNEDWMDGPIFITLCIWVWAIIKEKNNKKKII